MDLEVGKKYLIGSITCIKGEKVYNNIYEIDVIQISETSFKIYYSLRNLIEWIEKKRFNRRFDVLECLGETPKQGSTSGYICTRNGTDATYWNSVTSTGTYFYKDPSNPYS